VSRYFPDYAVVIDEELRFGQTYHCQPALIAGWVNGVRLLDNMADERERMKLLTGKPGWTGRQADVVAIGSGVAGLTTVLSTCALRDYRSLFVTKALLDEG
jgi:hypothetical protein